MESKIDDAYEEISYKVEMTVKNRQSFAENDNDNMDLFKRIDRVRRMTRTLRASSFCDIMNAKASVTVVDAGGVPVDSACVEFKLYNYAEFYTVATKYTSASGVCGLTAGKGDMLVWASKDGHFGFARLSFGKQSELTVKLDKKEGDAFATCVIEACGFFS